MKIVIDVDTELVDAAAAALGTKTEKDTIEAALRAAIDVDRRRRERRRMLLQSLGSADLGNPEVMSRAWR